MGPLKRLLRHCALFCLVYAVLLFLTHTALVQRTLLPMLVHTARWVPSIGLPAAYLHFESLVSARASPAVAGDAGLVRVRFGNVEKVREQMEAAKRAGKTTADLELHQFDLKAEEFFLLPLLFFLSLAAVTPVPTGRKIVGIAIGLASLQAFAGLKLLLYLLYNFASFPVGVYALTGFSFDLVAGAYTHLKMGAGMIVASLIWGAVFFRATDWRHTVRAITSRRVGKAD